MKYRTVKSVAIIVAHPDDEILWAGGTIMANPQWKYFIVSLCRKNDKNRAPKFNQVLDILQAKGIMGDLDDGPKQKPLDYIEIEQSILDLLPQKNFDLIITHNPTGEYTKHLRHEEISKAVITLWDEGEIYTPELWTFAYEDGNKAYYPKAIASGTYFETLSEEIWNKKYSLITETYGFLPNSWEAQTTPKSEAFWVFKKPQEAIEKLIK
jgi:LmbE family N-acetylglucosaminyl deacetylase